MPSGTPAVFHESNNLISALRGCTHFKSINRRESHFSQKITLKNRHFHHDKRCILENECSVSPPRCSTRPTTQLLRYEVAPASRTFADGNHTFPKNNWAYYACENPSETCVNHSKISKNNRACYACEDPSETYVNHRLA